MLRATWEDQVVEIAGARSGKTTTIAVPAILDAPGAVYATSNKRDIVDLTRGIREKTGPVWLFDPQAVAGGRPEFWWNPLDTVADNAGARQLAGLLMSASRPPGASVDAYFDPAAETLLGMLLLAAATATEPITIVHRWLSDHHDFTPVEVLKNSGHTMAAGGLRSTLELPDRQKAGVVGTALQAVSFLTDPRLTEWIIPPSDSRPRFDAARFVEDTATVYSLSKEGAGSAGAMTAAMTAAILSAAEQRATRSPGGRLPVPLVGVLDEVANVVRWRELPDLFSHYGSRSIVLLAFAQSWSQLCEAFGQLGARKMWGTANVRVYGGGVSDADFLDDLSRLCGEWDAPTLSRSNGRGGTSTTRGTRRERVFDPATLAALPSGRAVVLLSGTRPVLVATESCFDGPHAEQIKASIARHGRPTP